MSDICRCKQSMEYEALLVRMYNALRSDRAQTKGFPCIYDSMIREIKETIEKYRFTSIE